MQKSKMRLLGIILLLIALLFFLASSVQAIEVTAGLNKKEIYFGDTATLQVSVEGAASGAISAALPEVKGLSFTGPQTNSSRGFSILKGRRTESIQTRLLYEITPSRKGSFSIPSFEVEVGSSKYRTSPLKLRVLEPPTDKGLFLQASLSGDTCYPQQPVSITFKLFFSKRIGDYRYTIPLLDQADSLSIRLLRPEGRVQRGEINILNLGQRLEAGVEEAKLHGERYKVYSLSFQFFPKNEGVLTIAPATIRAEIEEGEEVVRDFFGIRRKRPKYKDAYASTKPLQLKVKPLPLEDRPPEFYGVVGNYKIDVKADRKRVKVGDPINLTLSITGEGIMKNVERPPLSELESFKEFKIDESLAPGEVEGNSIVFEQRIRASSETVEEIPSVPLAFFDVTSGEYKIARSKPIPIEVLTTRKVTAADIEGIGGEQTPLVEKKRIREKAGGLNANYFYLDALVNQKLNPFFLLPVLASPVIYLFFLVAVRYYRRRAGDPALLRQRGARKRVKEGVALTGREIEGDGRSFFEHLSRSLGQYVEDRYNLGAGEFTLLDLEGLAAQGHLSKDLAGEAREILKACDAGRFGSSSTSSGERRSLLERTEALIKNMERS